MQINTKAADAIICPACGHIPADYWDFPDEGTHECDNCGAKFKYSRYVEITYTTKLSERIE